MIPVEGARLPLDTTKFQVPPVDGPGFSKVTVNKDSKLYKACEDFQSIFIKQMLDAMRKTIDHSDDLLKRSQGQSIFEDMLYDQYAKNMSQVGGFGLAKVMYQQMDYLQHLPKAKV